MYQNPTGIAVFHGTAGIYVPTRGNRAAAGYPAGAAKTRAEVTISLERS